MSSAIRVLHVEDDPEFAALAGDLLERENDRLSVVTEHHPEDALDRLTDEHVDCVVSDYDLPDVDGIEFLERIRDECPGHPHTLELPFILFTGKGSEEIASDAISAGATDYLQKESGTDQYAILANRVVNAVDQRESMTNYREIFESAADGIFLHDPDDGSVNDVNPKAAEMLGYDREELVAMDVGEFSADRPEFSQAEAEQRVRAAIEDGPQTFEWLFEAKNGDEFWIEVHLKRVVINGRVQVIAMTRDVSERKERERELREERDRRAALFENRTDAIAYVEFERGCPVVASVNAAFEETFGFPESDVVGSPLDDAVVPGGGDASGDADAPEASEWARAGDQLDCEVTRETADGERAFRLRTAPIHPDDDEDVVGYAVYTDVSNRRERERRLQDQKEKVEALHDVAADIEASETPADVYDHVVDAAADILNYDRGIVDAVEDDHLVPVGIPEGVPPSEYHESTPVDADDSLAARAFRRGESILVDDVADLDVSPAEPTYRSALTVPIAEYGVFQAVTEEPGAFDETDLELTELLVTHASETLSRLEREAEMREYAAELERQNERLDEFASVVSHDLRNPLNVAAGRIDLAASEAESGVGAGGRTRGGGDSDADGGGDDGAGTDAKSVGEHLMVAVDALDRMDDIVEDTLSLAQDGRTVGDTECVNVAEMAEFAWSVVETPDATLDVQTDVTVEADPERFQTLLENLFRNALDHAGPSVTVTVGGLPDGFYVADDGPGIPESERDTAFDPGFTTHEDGTGFGLAIVEEIVDAHRGEISIRESADGGAKFEVTGFGVE